MSEIVGILESVGPTIVVEVTDVGPEGIQGLKGDKPAHSWDGTKLQFENPDGTAGTKVDLKGAKGDIGPAPTINYTTLAGEIDYDELSGYGDLSNYIRVVKHGTNGNTARPTGASVVYWVGTVEPTKALDDDMWLGGS